MKEMSIMELGKLERKISSLPERARAIEVKDKQSLDQAHTMLMHIKGVRKEINDFCDPNISRLNIAHKESIAQKRVFEHDAIEAENYIRPQIGNYLAKLEQIRRAAEEKARLEREAAERKVREEEEARLQAAIEAEEKGDQEEAEKILDREPIQDPLAQQTVVPFKTKLKGFSTRKIWCWQPEDPLGFEGIPREWMRLVPHSEKITAYVKEMKENAKIKGIRIFSKDITFQRSG